MSLKLTSTISLMPALNFVRLPTTAQLVTTFAPAILQHQTVSQLVIPHLRTWSPLSLSNNAVICLPMCGVQCCSCIRCIDAVVGGEKYPEVPSGYEELTGECYYKSGMSFVPAYLCVTNCRASCHRMGWGQLARRSAHLRSSQGNACSLFVGGRCVCLLVSVDD